MAATSVFLNVTDLDAALRFWKTLGFRVTEDHRKGDAVRWCDLELDGAGVGVGEIGSNADPGFRAWASPPLGNGVVVYLEVADADRVWRKATRGQLTVETPIHDRPYGRAFTLNDPDGYTVTFLGPVKRARKPAARKTARKRRAPARRSAAKRRR